MKKPVPELRLVAKLKNNRLINAREKLGFATASAFAKSIKMNLSEYCKYESLGRPARRKSDGEWCKSALRIAIALSTPPEYLWPESLDRVQKTCVVIELEPPTGIYLPPPETPEEALISTQTKACLDAAMTELSHREEVILRAHFGLDGEEQTLEEVSSILSVSRGGKLSRSRIGQLKDRALVKMRKALGGP